MGSVHGVSDWPMVQRWWCEEAPRRHIYLRRAPSGLAWRLDAVKGDGDLWQRLFEREADARAFARAMRERSEGLWHAEPRDRL